MNKGTQVLLIVEVRGKFKYAAVLLNGIHAGHSTEWVEPPHLLSLPISYHSRQMEQQTPHSLLPPAPAPPPWQSYCHFRRHLPSPLTPRSLSHLTHAARKIQRQLPLRTVKLLCPSVGQLHLKKVESLCISISRNEPRIFSKKNGNTLRKGLWVPKDHKQSFLLNQPNVSQD